MTNHDPVVDAAGRTSDSLIDAMRTAEGGRFRSDSSRRSRRAGRERWLTEMGEIAAAGVRASPTTALPVAAPGADAAGPAVRRRNGAEVALHCEETSLSRDGQMHDEGAVSPSSATGYQWLPKSDGF